MAWRKKSSGKRVTFANPLCQILGIASKEQRIWALIDAAPGWAPVASPKGADGATETGQQDVAATHIIPPAMQHLPKPLTNKAMVALQTMVEQGNQPKSKKRSKVVPVAAAPGGIADGQDA
ncbi:unnamed protein product [Urochloa humidicola]